MYGIEREMASSIPKVIYQTYPISDLPEDLAKNVDHIRRMNPKFDYRLFDDNSIHNFVGEAYGDRVLRVLNKIDSRYGAARADLFRYLLIYHCGGVYLDIKSSTTRPLDQLLRLEEKYILTCTPEQQFHNELAFSPLGEFHQWHIIGVAGHPFLKAVIERVIGNIENYRAWNGVGKLGVLKTSGPIAYTSALYPIREQHPHRLFCSVEEAGLSYSFYEPEVERIGYQKEPPHARFFPSHYSNIDHPIVKNEGLTRLADELHIVAQRFRHKVARSTSAYRN